MKSCIFSVESDELASLMTDMCDSAEGLTLVMNMRGFQMFPRFASPHSRDIPQFNIPQFNIKTAGFTLTMTDNRYSGLELIPPLFRAL